ncbi:hypothetical protein ACU4GD_12995 [Cupriavidus basilensis]
MAVHTEHEDGRRAGYSCAYIQAGQTASRGRCALGVARGDRVGIVMPSASRR